MKYTPTNNISIKTHEENLQKMKAHLVELMKEKSKIEDQMIVEEIAIEYLEKQINLAKYYRRDSFDPEKFMKD